MADGVAALREQVTTLTVAKLAELNRAFPGLVMPRTFAGHPVDDQSSAHLLKAMSLLVSIGVDEIDGLDLRRRALEMADATDPSITGFASFSFGESIVGLGGLDAVADPERALAAVRDPELNRRLLEDDRPPPPNFNLVAARCLFEEHALTGHEPALLDTFVDRSAVLLHQRDTGWIDDMPDPLVHFDMYTPDVYLFAAPLRDRFGKRWEHGFRQVIADLDHLVHPGGAICWGRSSGLLALAMTVELTAYGACHGLLTEPSPWFQRARLAADRLDALLPGGIAAAHQHRSTMSYRGPFRRLQMSFDLLDKLAASAARLHAAPPTAAASRAATWPTTDRLVAWAPDHPTSGVWAHRNGSLDFALPFLHGFSTDYGAAPRSPGLFEVPTEGHPCFVPTFWADGKARVPAALPTGLAHRPGGIAVEHTGWARPGRLLDDEGTAGHRRADYTVSGRTLTVTEDVAIDDPTVDEITISIPEVAGRPLDVACDRGIHRVVDTAGIAEWRSFWSELPVVHQLEVPVVDGQATFTWSVQPRLRVGSMMIGHPYDDALYGPLGDRVTRVPLPSPGPDLFDGLGGIDIVHMAWPEHHVMHRFDDTAAVIDAVRDSHTPIVWTQHNLVSHFDKSEAAYDCYRQWAAAADLVIHHSDWGRSAGLAALDYGAHTRHIVIPHGHWGDRHRPHATVDRATAEAEAGWDPVPIRLAVIGRARVEKRLQDVLDAFAACGRDDIELVIRVSGDETVPDHPRLRIDDDRHLDDRRYLRRLRAVDALVLPFGPAGMLTTGTAFDAIGAGLAVITSDWGFLDETFGDAAIRYGSTAAELEDCLRALTVEQLDNHKAAVAALRPRFDWGPIAEATFTSLTDLVP